MYCDFNTFVGGSAGLSNTGGRFNTFVGADAGNKNETGYHNTFMGASSGYNNTGSSNTFSGYYAGYGNTSGSSNTFIGYWAGRYNSDGNDNTFLGWHAGNDNTTGSGHVFIGHSAGYYETGSNKLYIDNSDTPTPLIWGDFATDILAVNGRLGVGTQPEASYQFHSKDQRSTGRAIYGEATGNNSIGVWGKATAANSTGVWGEGANYAFYAAAGTTDYGPFTGAHEVKIADDTTEVFRPGMIVSVTGQTQTRRNEDGTVSLSSTLPTVQLSRTPRDKAVIGVFTKETPLHEGHWYEADTGERFGIVNALGEGRVWVSDINGPIEAGDYITSSPVPGYGQKQGDDLVHSYTVGKAIETLDWDTVTETVVYNGNEYRLYLIALVYTSG